MRELMHQALRSLRAHRFRSLLTVSSITLGAFSIVVMSSLAQSGLTTLVRDLEELGGARIIMIAPKKPERTPGHRARTHGELTVRDRDHLFAAVPRVTGRAMYAALDRKDVELDTGKGARTDLVAADAGFFDVLGLRLAKGRLLTEEDDLQRARVCVVAFDTARTLFDGDAVGKGLTIDGERCEVIGQLAKVDHWDTNFGFAWLDFVALPYRTVTETRPGVSADAVIQLRTDRVASNDLVKRIVNAILVDRHRGVDDFQIWDFNAFMAQFNTMFAVMEAIVGLIAGIALVVGGIGVMNMMLVSVSERTREIGIRKAIGAPPEAIAAQFLAEATALAGFGGLLGVGAGILATFGANALIHHLQPLWVGEVSLVAVLVALGAALGIGLGFGYFPARSASRLDPVAAMRR